MNSEKTVEPLQVAADILLQLAPDLRVDAQEDARREDEDRQEENPSNGYDELTFETAQVNQYKDPFR